MLLNDGKVIFSLFIILYKFSRFNFCFCDSVCLVLFGCALFGCVVFPFSEVGASFLLGYFCFLILDVPCGILLFCSLFIFFIIYYLFFDIFLVFQNQKINLSLLFF